MQDTTNSAENNTKYPLLSLQFLKYFGIVLVVLMLYVIVSFYNKYSGDIFSISLNFGQHIKLGFLSIGSQFYPFTIVPVLFFAGALLYRTVRIKGMNPLGALKRDVLIMIPLGIAFWLYGAFCEANVKTNFYSMVFEIQVSEPGEKLVQDPNLLEQLKFPDLNGLHSKIDTLDTQIKEAEDGFVEHLAKLIPPSQVEEILAQIDFGTNSITAEDVRNSTRKWNGIALDTGSILNNGRGMVHYIESIRDQQNKLRDEINLIHLTPLYVLLFLVFGILLGYLIPFRILPLLAVLILIGFAWHVGMNYLEVAFDVGYSNKSAFMIGKICLLIVLNSVLLIVSQKVFKRTQIAIDTL